MQPSNLFRKFFIQTIQTHCFIVLGVIIILAVMQYYRIAYGFVVGGVLSVFFFQNYYHSLNQLGHQQQLLRKRVFSLFFLKYVVWYCLIFAVLFVAMKKNIHFFLGAACGVLSIKFELMIRICIESFLKRK